ncbi:MAG TPA: VCBS repeat-containing protein, partial [Phycicoccus sp.]
DTERILTTPRLDAQGSLYYEADYDPFGNPSSRLFRADLASGAASDSGQVGRTEPVFGYDVRQPQTKGSSHLVGDRGEDLLARDASGVLWTYPAANGVGNLVGKRQRIGGGWLAYPAVVTGDFTSDDRTDLLAKDAAGGLWLYAGRPTGGMGARTKVGSGWASYLLVSPGDWDGDGRADLLARDASGALWLYPGTGRGTLGPRRQVGSGWNGMNVVLGAGDPDLDNRMDLVARDIAGTLWLYPGRGDGGFLSRRRLGTGWQGFTALAVKEVTDQTTYVWARTRSGALYAYPIIGDGRFAGSYDTVGSGWNGYLITS